MDKPVDKKAEEKRVKLTDILPDRVTAEEIMKAIKSWVEYNSGNVIFFGRFMTVDMDKVKKGEKEVVGEDISCAFGDAELLKEFSHDMYDELAESDDKFIDW